jgi:hypothetical protein
MVKYSYCLDSGVFINSWHKNFPPDIFPSVWDHLDKLCRENIVFTLPEVAQEIYPRDDDVAKWLKARKKIVVRRNDDIIWQMKEIMNSYPKLAGEGSGRSGADPWVISHAIYRRATVVTEERESGSLNKPRIPDVCSALQVVSINTVDLLRATGLRL